MILASIQRLIPKQMMIKSQKQIIKPLGTRMEKIFINDWKISSDALPASFGFRFKGTFACPVHGDKGISADSVQKKYKKVTPKLVNIPKLPFLGSVIPQHSGACAFDLNKPYDTYSINRERFGDFYSIGIPIIGVGLFAEVHVITDPKEMLKVLRKEGPYPYGAIGGDWPLIQFNRDANSHIMDKEDGFFGRGELWKKQRRFLQTDLLSPVAAKGYLPGIIKAAQHASKGAPYFASDINNFMARSSFDLFSTIIFGEMTGVANPQDSEPDPENVKFCEVSVAGLETVFPLMVQPHVQFMVQKLGIKSPFYKYFDDKMTSSRNIALSKMNTFRKKKEEGKLNENETASYLSLAIDRQEADGGLMTNSEVAEIGILMLTAALDTTSSILNWSIIHLALNQEVQLKLHAEVFANVDSSEEKVLSEAFLTKAAAPYLHAFIRENHRLTPAIPISIVKDNSTSDVEIHGVTIPKGSKFILDSHSIGKDSTYVPDHKAFKPERWSEDEVKARKGTPAEILDHALYRDPFSAGARKCPGSRVANYESLVMISQLVLDWKISLADDSIHTLDDVAHFMGLTVQPTVPELKFEPRN